MAVKEFTGGAGPVFSNQWTNGTGDSYPQPGDQLVVHGAGDLVYAANANLGGYFFNIGGAVSPSEAPTVSFGNTAANVYNDWLTGPSDSKVDGLLHRWANISAWGQYDVINLGDYTSGGTQDVITTAQGTTLYYNQKTVAPGNQDNIIINGGGTLNNYGVSDVRFSNDVVSIPEIDNGLWQMANARMEFQNVYVAPTVNFEVNGSSALVIDSPASATQSPFQGHIGSEAFTNSLILFNGPEFDHASYSNGALTLSLGDFKQTFSVDLHTNGGGPLASWSVWQTSTGAALAPGSEKPQQAIGNPIFSYTPHNG